ncbi:hypothetical protein [Chamaesiphon minutus]|nr:hypothetical protein [Chamaesiphon minutus]
MSLLPQERSSVRTELESDRDDYQKTLTFTGKGFCFQGAIGSI